MAQRTRMIKTLAILVASMTATTMLLSRLERAALRALPSPEQLRQWARLAVASANPFRPGTWNGIEIILERELTAPGGKPPVAVPHTGDYHFWVGATGRVWSSTAWREQSTTSVDGVIRVVLGNHPADAAIPPGPWTSLQMLLAELKAALEPTGEPHAPAGWIRLSDEAARDLTLRALLRAEGLEPTHNPSPPLGERVG